MVEFLNGSDHGMSYDYPTIHMDGLRNITRNLSQEMKSGSQKHDAEMLINHITIIFGIEKYYYTPYTSAYLAFLLGQCTRLKNGANEDKEKTETL